MLQKTPTRRPRKYTVVHADPRRKSRPHRRFQLSSDQLVSATYHNKSTKDADVLVIRVRGAGATTSKQERTLRSLALKRIGSARFGSELDGSFWGQVQKVEHALAIIQMQVPPEVLVKGHRRGVNMTSQLEPYGDSKSPSQFLQLADEEYIQYDPGADSRCVTWTSMTDALRAIDLISQIAGSPTRDEGSFAFCRLVG